MADGTRTRGHRDHNPELYQLSYRHRARTGYRCRTEGYPLPARPRSSVDRAAAFEAARGGSTPPGATLVRPQETIYIIEDDPPPTRPRWFCAEHPAGFGDIDEGIRWALDQAPTVIIRTVGNAFYWAGERPSDPSDAHTLPWPTSAAERAEIDAAYERAWKAAEEHEAAWERHEALRDEWLAENAPNFVGRGPNHRTHISAPDAGTIDLEEYGGGRLCSAWHHETWRSAFGTSVEVVSRTCGVDVSDPWVQAVGAALTRERAWPSGRRHDLDVRKGSGELFHVTASRNRDSIREHGLDWTRMTGRGIAGSSGPELDAVFLCDSLDDAEFFIWMGSEPVDVWGVGVDGYWLESGPDGWWIISERIPSERLRLAVSDRAPRPPKPSTTGEGFGYVRVHGTAEGARADARQEPGS